MSSKALVGALQAGAALFEYRIERVLGHGGFGTTYLAEDTHLHKRVAIKEYLPNELAARTVGQTVAVRSPEAREQFDWGRDQFSKEARVLARFSHPNLIRVHRFFELNGTAYFVMEYAEGTTLASLLKQVPLITEQRLRSILLPIAEGLEQVHRQGVLHRDIKPNNIILRSDDTPVLIDFGSARQDTGRVSRSVLGMVTAGYSPLEQYGSSQAEGPWTDVYALGAVAYRAVAGKRPDDAVNRVRKDPLVPAVEVGRGRFSPRLLSAIDWALAVNAEDRPRTIADWRAAFDERAAGVPVEPAARAVADGSGDTQVISRFAPVRKWTRYALATGAVLALAAGAEYVLRRGIAPPPPPVALPEKVERVPISAMLPLATFQDCSDCPVMGVLPAGSFSMGSAPGTPEAHPTEFPPHAVNLRKPFAIGWFEVTLKEWLVCVAAQVCPPLPAGPVRGDATRAPVVNLTWNEALIYTGWLSEFTGRNYRLPSEAEWEYAMRAGTSTSRYWGNAPALQCEHANGADASALTLDDTLPAGKDPCADGFAALAPVGNFAPNKFNLYDMAGNAAEWTLDCYTDNHSGAPSNGVAINAVDCRSRVIRGGSWRTGPTTLRSAARRPHRPGERAPDVGFRVLAE